MNSQQTFGPSAYQSQSLFCLIVSLGRGQVKNPTALITSMLKYNFEPVEKLLHT